MLIIQKLKPIKYDTGEKITESITTNNSILCTNDTYLAARSELLSIPYVLRRMVSKVKAFAVSTPGKPWITDYQKTIFELNKIIKNNDNVKNVMTYIINDHQKFLRSPGNSTSINNSNWGTYYEKFIKLHTLIKKYF